MKRNVGDYLIDIFAYTALCLFAASTLLPFMNIVSKSLSEEWAVVSGKVGILPVGMQFDTFKYVISSKAFLNSFGVSVLITLVGTGLSIALTAVTAYPLSKKTMPLVKGSLVLYIFTMMFNGGLIPNYLLIRNLGLMDSLWAIILPGIINVFNMLVIKSYYESLPESIEESARIDGASNFTIVFGIVIPLSTPVLATVALFYAVAFWNDYFNPMLYINKLELKPLQLYLREIVLEAVDSIGGMTKSADEMMNISPEGVRAATVIASTVPIVIVYPFFQKYFIKGILIGSVKG